MITFSYDPKIRKAKMVCEEPSVFSFVRNHFSVKNEGAAFANKKLKMQGSTRRVPDRFFAIQESGNFDLGLYDEIINFLISEQLTDIQYEFSFTEVLKKKVDVEVKDDLRYELRDYQKETIQKCLETTYGTVVIGTGGGKSLIQASLIENWKFLHPNSKVLVIVPGLSLVNQLNSDFEQYEVSFSFAGWSGGTEYPDVDVIITNSENLYSQFGNYKNLVDVDLVLVDECHKIKKNNEITKILQKIKTINKFGFTGTLPKEKIDEWKIIGTFGPVIVNKNSKSLRDENFLVGVEIKMMRLNHGKVPKMNYSQELEYLQTNESRNNIIKKICQKLNNNVLILVNRLDHGEQLVDILTVEGKDTYFVYGEMEVEERQKIIQKMEENDNIICIAMSSIFSTGINIKNLHYIFLTFGGKSFIRTIQSIGRGLRLHETKNKLVLFDMYDSLKYSQSHADERMKYYEEEQIPWKDLEIRI